MKKVLMDGMDIKIAISLNKLLVASKIFKKIDDKLDPIATSYNKIALDADIRKATVSDTFNSKSIPRSTTLILIVEAMGYKLYDFAKIYDSITNDEILEFEKSITKH
ncbi:MULTISPECIES: hypothetical protein [unclassified Gillisia]|uniref:hypothetical protein n=1 Tax=unclassified Gillisia TaxID=2615025 RepID=UPI000551E9C1|nr:MULTISPECIES: hypothetical protein [unclassified Gillisia]